MTAVDMITVPPGPAASADSRGPERERLRKDIFHHPGEIQRQQQGTTSITVTRQAQHATGND
jgi:hypothetical protein